MATSETYTTGERNTKRPESPAVARWVQLLFLRFILRRLTRM